MPIVPPFTALALGSPIRKFFHRFSFPRQKSAILLSAESGTPSARGLGRLHPQFRTVHGVRAPFRSVPNRESSQFVTADQSGFCERDV